MGACDERKSVFLRSIPAGYDVGRTAVDVAGRGGCRHARACRRLGSGGSCHLVLASRSPLRPARRWERAMSERLEEERAAWRRRLGFGAPIVLPLPPASLSDLIVAGLKMVVMIARL